MQSITLPQLPWHGTRDLNLPVPDSWQVTYYRMAGWDRPALNPHEIKAAVSKPIGIPPIRELARGKRQVVIIFDDMTRVTRAAEIIPPVLSELAEAGIRDEQIRFICALGCHGAHNRLDFIKKLGAGVLSRFPVYNHNPFDRCLYVGTTKSYNTKLYINAEVMQCDLKIALGMVAPHPATGYGGGGKIILPGVASFESTRHNHRAAMEDALRQRENPVIGMGIFDNNPMRIDCEEAAALAGLDVLINCVVNEQGETAAVFAGHPQAAYAEAVMMARSHYQTPPGQGERLVVANAFSKASEAIAVGLGTAFSAAGARGGSVILIANAPDGQVTHYLMGPFGRESAGELSFKLKVPDHIERVCIFSEYPDVTGRDYLEASDKISFSSTWDDVLEALQDGKKQAERVAVYPSADVQCIAQSA